MTKKILKIALIVLGIIVVLIAALFTFLTVTEYKPAPVETVPILRSGRAETPLSYSEKDDGNDNEDEKEEEGFRFSILSWNTGYGGLGKDADFFMDGGKGVRSADEVTVKANLAGITTFLNELSPDFCLLQEVDSGSTRTYNIDERTYFSYADSAYALNYSCRFVPYPLPPIGRVNSGIFTLTDHPIESAERIALPSPFSWPVSTANLKRCLLVTRIALEDTDRELVLVNLHLEAYDDGEGKAAQTAMLKQVIEREYAAGNYVIAGGDFNQSFPEALAAYPVKNEKLWTPGILSDGDLSAGWRFAYDVSVPSCRLLNQPYDPASPATQYYTIDGFILSPNVKLESVRTLNTGFSWTDHNPVLLNVTLASE